MLPVPRGKHFTNHDLLTLQVRNSHFIRTLLYGEALLLFIFPKP